MDGLVQSMHPIGGPDSNLRALEVTVLRTHVDEDLLMVDNEDYTDPIRWDPLIMKFTEFFAGGRQVQASSLARGWGMPRLPEQPLVGVVDEIVA